MKALILQITVGVIAAVALVALGLGIFHTSRLAASATPAEQVYPPNPGASWETLFAR